MTITVLDAQIGKPIAGATVAVLGVPFFGRAASPTRTNAWSSITDERGIAVVQLSQVNPTPTISVEHTNYAPRQVRWSLPGGRIDRLPNAYTFKLERGITIGGFVRNEKGEAVAGVKVVPWGENFVYPQGVGPLNPQQEYSAVVRNDEAGIVTDAKGFWSLANFPADLESVWLEVIRPGGARSRFLTDAAGMRYGEPTTEVRLVDLRATKAVLTLPEGATVRGIVVDGQGRAIPNARIRERRGRMYQHPIYEFNNNADGRFELPHRAHAQYMLAAEAPGFASKSIVITAGSEPEVRIVLSEARPLRLRVLGSNDEPLQSTVQALEYRSEQLVTWYEQTDKEGRVVWTNAPMEPFTLSVVASNYAGHYVRLTADGTEKVIRMSKVRNQGVAVSVKAIDAQTGKPLDWFRVRRNTPYGEGFVSWGEPPNRSGEFQTNILATELQRGPGNLRVQVWADKYAPWTSRTVYFDEGDQSFVAMLTNAPLPAGTVLQPNGSPAGDAKLLLNTSIDTVFMNNTANDFFDRPGTYWVRSASDGLFSLPPAEEHNRVLVKHPSGFAALTVGELLRTNQIRLQPWARIEGTLRGGGKPLANERISLKSPINWLGHEGYSLNILTTSDSNGAFTYTNLPPGEYLLYRVPVLISGMTHTESHPWPLDIAAGERKRIDYGFGGRTVAGTIEAGGPVDWSNDSHMLTLKGPEVPPPPNYYDFVEQKEFEKERRAYAKSAALKQYERQRRQFQLVFDRDGSFRVDDVPAGTYEMRVRVTRPPKDPNMRYARSEEQLGLLVKEVSVPPGAAGEEYDLGSLEMELKGANGAKAVAQTMAELRAVTLDGKAFNLESIRGKPAVLLFWAHWAPKSAARLTDLRALQESTNAPISFVTVNLDEDAGLARAAVRDFKRGIHTRLEGRARVEMTERCGIDTLPNTLVLDDQGRIIARDVEGRRLRSALERALGKMAKK